MGDLINLNDFRKRRTKQRASAATGENRAKSGRGRSRRQRETVEADLARAALDGKHLDDGAATQPNKRPANVKPANSRPDGPARKP